MTAVQGNAETIKLRTQRSTSSLPIPTPIPIPSTSQSSLSKNFSPSTNPVQSHRYLHQLTVFLQKHNLSPTSPHSPTLAPHDTPSLTLPTRHSFPCEQVFSPLLTVPETYRLYIYARRGCWRRNDGRTHRRSSCWRSLWRSNRGGERR